MGRSCGGGFEDADLGVTDGIRVVVDVHLLDVSLAFFEIEMLDVVLLAPVEVYGFFVDEYEGTGIIDFADDIGLSRDVDDHKIVARNRAQADGVGRIGLVRPVVVSASAMQEARFREPRT